MPLAGEALHVGYACAWWVPRESTWSYTAVRLRHALAAHARVTDIEAQRSYAGKALLAALYLPRRGVPWQYSAIERHLIDRTVRRQVRVHKPQVVLGIGEVDTPSDVPSFLYQDANVAAILDHEAQAGTPRSNLLPSSASLLRRRAAEQNTRVREATGIFVMGQWFKDFLVVHHGVPAERVVVAPAGMNNPPTRFRDPDRPSSGRLLFVGTDFERKGGDLVVEAVRRLNSARRPQLRLTVAGPSRWPLPGVPPPFVDFRGPLGPAEVATAYAEHDALVMPSRYEAFGIVFAEALAAGLPCVARRAFAMGDIVQDGETGALVDTEDPDELAEAINRVLGDEAVFTRVAEARPKLTATYNWDATAATMVRHMSRITAGG